MTNVESGKRCESLDKASIFFKDIPQDVIDALIKEGEVFYCAGGLMVEAPSIQPYREHPSRFLPSNASWLSRAHFPWLLAQSSFPMAAVVKIEGSMDSVMGFGRSTASKLLDQALEA